MSAILPSAPPGSKWKPRVQSNITIRHVSNLPQTTESTILPLIVSAYFKIPSKRPHSEYILYLQNFFSSISGPAIFFTSDDVYDELKARIPPNFTICIMSIENFEAQKRYGEEFWNYQNSINPQVDCNHTAMLGMIWYEKKEFVLRAISLFPMFDAYVWCDAGCIRTEESIRAARYFGRRNSSWLLDNKLHIQSINYQPPEWTHLRAHMKQYIAGAIMGGTRVAWLNYKTAYDNMILEYVERGFCCLDDQYVTLGCVYASPHLFVEHTDPSNVDKWFKFLEKI